MARQTAGKASGGTLYSYNTPPVTARTAVPPTPQGVGKRTSYEPLGSPLEGWARVRPFLGSPLEGELSRRPCVTEGVSFPNVLRWFYEILRCAQDERGVRMSAHNIFI